MLPGNAFLVMLLLHAAPTTDAPQVQKLLKQAQVQVDELEYEQALFLLDEVVVDRRASLGQLILAHYRAAVICRILDRNVEAREHYLWVLMRDPDVIVHPDEPPKVSGFFAMIRENALASGIIVKRSARSASAPPAKRGGRRQGGQSTARKPSRGNLNTEADEASASESVGEMSDSPPTLGGEDRPFARTQAAPRKRRVTSAVQKSAPDESSKPDGKYRPEDLAAERSEIDDDEPRSFVEREQVGEDDTDQALGLGTIVITSGFGVLAGGGLLTLGALSAGSIGFVVASNAISDARTRYLASANDGPQSLDDAQATQNIYGVVSLAAYAATGVGVIVAAAGASLVVAGGGLWVMGEE